MKKKIFLLLCLIALGSLQIKTHLFDPVLAHAAYPLLLIHHQITRPYHTLVEWTTGKYTLLQKNTELTEHIETLQKEVVSLRSSFHHWQKIKELVEFNERYNTTNTNIGCILLKSFTPTEHFLYVNRGSNDCIKTNMIATYKFQLLGKVTQVFARYCKVVLITDPHSKIAAYTDREHSQGIVSGNGTKNCLMEYIDLHSKHAKDELIFSSGNSMVFPEGFSIGQIVSIEKLPTHQNLTLEPLVNFETLKCCSLLDPEKIPAF